MATKKVTKSEPVLRREQFEKENPGRFVGIEAHRFGNESPADSYKRMDIGVAHHPLHTSLGQMELPGLSHPGTVKPIPHWQDMPEKSRQRVEKRAAEYGVTRESAKRSFAASVDQGALREGRHRSFYDSEGLHPSGEMTPRERLKTSATENKVPFHVQAVANAITSPKMPFSRTAKSGPNAGNRIYPNDLQATGAIKDVQSGKNPEDVRAVPGVGGMHGNSQRAAKAVSGVLREGKSVAESWNAGPKTGAYHNSWVDPHGPSQRLTSDIHTGGGGFAPHLPVAGKGSREEYLGISGIHSFHDDIAREVASERGISSISGMQSLQWNEERDRRNTRPFAHERKAGGTESTESFMGHVHGRSQKEIPGQQKLF